MAAMCGRCARKLQHFRVPWQLSVRSLCAASSNSPSFEVDEDQSIQASYATKRDPMAVLKALASTVKPVPHLPNPEFIEDIYLLPRSKARQEACLLAKQSGREAAQFVISRCPGIFPLREPNPGWITEDPVLKLADVKTEKDLKYFIKLSDARNAVLSYERLKEQGVEVLLDTQNELLDLAAQRLGNIPAKLVLSPDGEEVKSLSMNPEESMSDNNVEEEKTTSAEEEIDFDADFAEQENDGRTTRTTTTNKAETEKDVTPEWRDDNYALQMFDSMTTKSARTYETMVLGFLKYRRYLEAYGLFNEMREHGYQASVFTYNLLFKAIARSLAIDSKWARAKELVKSMGEEPVVVPNLKTYNALMKVAIVSSEEGTSATELTLGLLRDILASGMEPTMESFNQLLRAEYIPYWEVKKNVKTGQKLKDDDERMSRMVNPLILNKVITHLESLPRLPPLQDPEDGFFFRTAMSAALLCKDVNLAIRIYNLVEKQNNTAYLGEKQAPFYSSFLLTLTSAEADFSLLYDYYKKIVPEKFRPKEHIYTSLFNLAARTHNPGVVKVFYEDMRIHRVQLTTTVATALFRALGSSREREHVKSNLATMLDVLRWMKMYRVEVTHVIITQLIRMHCLNDQLEEAWEALDMFKNTGLRVPTFTALNDILLLGADQKDPSKVTRCFEMMAEYGYNLNKKRRHDIYTRCQLPLAERKRLDSLFQDLSELDERRRHYFPRKQAENRQEFDRVSE